MRLLINFVLSRHGLASKYGITFQISVYNWTQNCIFLCQSDKAIIETWFSLLLNERCF